MTGYPADRSAALTRGIRIGLAIALPLWLLIFAAGVLVARAVT